VEPEKSVEPVKSVEPPIQPKKAEKVWEDRLEKVEIIEQADVFRAGTFRFDKNPNYFEKIEDFEVKMKLNYAQLRNAHQGSQRFEPFQDYFEKMK